MKNVPGHTLQFGRRDNAGPEPLELTAECGCGAVLVTRFCYGETAFVDELTALHAAARMPYIAHLQRLGIPFTDDARGHGCPNPS